MRSAALLFIILANTSANVLSNKNVTNLVSDLDASKNCAHNLHNCHTLSTVLGLIVCLLFISNIVTVCVWNRHILRDQIQNLAARVRGEQAAHQPLQNDFD